MPNHDPIRKRVSDYYSGKLAAHGATHCGVDWNSRESQELRFEQLLKLVGDLAQPFSINDYGCGYGALVTYLAAQGFSFSYVGFDFAEALIREARSFLDLAENCEFVIEERALPRADYTVASGLFNVKLQTDAEDWAPYMLDTLERMWELSGKGMAFNALTKYSDPEYMRPDLYYADPCFLFDHCKTRFSRHVALLHDYGLYEFTILVRR